MACEKVARVLLAAVLYRSDRISDPERHMSQMTLHQSLCAKALVAVLAIACQHYAVAAGNHGWEIKGPAEVPASRATAVLEDYQRLVGDRSEAGADGVFTDYYASAIAIDGDTLAVGAPRDLVGLYNGEGSVYVYVWVESAWQLQAKLVTQLDVGEVGTSAFGFSLALKDDTLIVGAPYASVGPPSSGAVFVLDRSGSDWTLSSTVTASDAEIGADFGAAVAFDGDTLVVGATKYSSSTQQPGSAYVFSRNAGSWQEQAELVSSDGGWGDSFGERVAVHGGRVVVGAPRKMIDTNQAQGAAYIFSDAPGSWQQEARLVDAQGVAGAEFGAALGLNGETILVGAPNNPVNGASAAGSAFVFQHDNGSWNLLQRIDSPDLPSSNFGQSIAINESVALIGSPNRSVSNPGTVYAYEVQNWNPVGEVTPTSGHNDVGFGYVLALDELRAAVSTYVFQSPIRGRVYSIRQQQGGWVEESSVDAGPGVSETRLGEAVAIDGNTALVGVPGATVNGNVLQGEVQVYVRDDQGWAITQRLVAMDGAINDGFGSALALDGDTAVIANFYSGLGAVYVFVRTANGWEQQAKLTPLNPANDSFGQSLALFGDTVVVGARQRTTAAGETGAVFVFGRSDGMWMQRMVITPNDAGVGDLFGSAVSLYRDTLLVGAPFHDNAGNPNQGAGYVFELHEFNWTQRAKLVAAGPSSFVGRSAAMNGDTAFLGSNAPTTNGGRDLVFAFTVANNQWVGLGPVMDGDMPATGFFSPLAFNGERLLIGGPIGADGTVGVFRRSGMIWQLEKQLLAREGRDFDGFGRAIAMDADTALVGAPTDSGMSVFNNPWEGAAYLFELDGETPVFADGFE